MRAFAPERAAGIALARRIDWSSAKLGKLTVLCLERSQFIKDIEELRRLTDLNWVTLNAVRLRLQQEPWVPEAARQQGYFTAWLKAGEGARIRPILESFAVALLEEAQRTMRVDAVATANIDYWQDEAMKLACRQLGIPFVVLCRENYSIPWTVPWMHDHLVKSHFHFEGAGLAVFSQHTKNAFLPAFDDPNDVWVTGAPRYDRWLHLEPLPESDKTFISLVTFNDPGYMAVNTFLETAEIFDRVARAEAKSGLTWLVKCKKRGDRNEVLQRVGSRDDSPLKFEFDTPLFTLFPRSRVVVGCNSLALVEAMLTDAPVVVPCWGEAHAERHNVMLDYNDPLTCRVVTFAKSPEEFTELLTRAARGEQLKTGSPEDRRALFQAHLHLPGSDDGPLTASSATEAFVRHYVEKYRQMQKSQAA
ncbi:MAG: hypothetical protein IPK59_21800 [Rhodospirillaceae bacterium]|nr:hypothetical protein [Rhodospirillaceae bacterium]